MGAPTVTEDGQVVRTVRKYLILRTPVFTLIVEDVVNYRYSTLYYRATPQYLGEVTYEELHVQPYLNLKLFRGHTPGCSLCAEYHSRSAGSC